MSGIDGKIPIPSKEEMQKLISSNLDHYEKMLEIVVRQPFWDGNKRTAYLFTVLEVFRETGKIFDIDIKKYSKDLHNKYNVFNQLIR